MIFTVVVSPYIIVGGKVIYMMAVRNAASNDDDVFSGTDVSDLSGLV